MSQQRTIWILVIGLGIAVVVIGLLGFCLLLFIVPAFLQGFLPHFRP